MVLKFYFDLLSQPCRALYILLKQSNIPFEPFIVNIGAGEHLSKDFKSINRFQKLPVIENDGFTLFESIAILRYLARVKGLPEEWYPSDPEKQARVDEYLEWQHHNTRLTCTLYFQRKWLFPLLKGKTTPPEKLVPYEKNMSDCLDSIEKHWLTPGPFIIGDQITVADIWAACEIEQPRMAGYEPTLGRPILSAWLQSVRSATNPYYDEAHVFLRRIAEKSKQDAAKAKL